MGEVLLNHNWEKYLLGNVFTSIEYAPDGWQETCWDLCGKTLPLKEKQHLIMKLFNQKQVTNEKQNKCEKQASQPITAWSYDMERHAVMDTQHAGTLSRKSGIQLVAKAWHDRSGTIDQFFHHTKNTTGSIVSLEARWRCANLDCSMTCLLLEIYSRRSVVRIWTTNTCSNFWYLQETNNSADSETNSLDAGLRMEGIPAFQMWDREFETVPHSDSEGHLQRPSGRPSLWSSC